MLKKFRSLTVILVFIIILIAVIVILTGKGSPVTALVEEVRSSLSAAVSVTVPPTSGLLKRSDTPLSPRSYRTDWEKAYKGFSSNRILWTYAGAQFVKTAGPKGVAVQCTVPFWVPETHADKEKMVCTNAKGGYGGSPSDADQGSGLRRPDINSAAWRTYQLGEVKKLIDAGCTSFQQDNPALNTTLVATGGCYADESVAGFRAYIAAKYPTPKWQTLGIKDITTFDYRKETSTKLKKEFEAFQQKSVEDYHDWLHKEAIAYAATKGIKTITFSGNITNGQLPTHKWILPHFDFLISELYAEKPKAVSELRTMAKNMQATGKVNAITLADDDTWLNQRVAASAYALGLTAIAPWDVYLDAGEPRFYGSTSDFANIFSLVSKNTSAFDDYVSGTDEYGSYTSVIPSQGYVDKIDTTTYPERTTVYWTRRGDFKTIATGKTVYIDSVQYATTVNSIVGMLYLPKNSPVSVGDPVYISGAPAEYLISVRKNVNDASKKAVHMVSWRLPTSTSPTGTVVLYLHLKKSDFPTPPTKLMTSSDPVGKAITPVTLGDYYIYPVGNVFWAVLVP